jgi:DNA-binding transcriptional regulator YdaS (Cro superfamily)
MDLMADSHGDVDAAASEAAPAAAAATSATDAEDLPVESVEAQVRDVVLTLVDSVPLDDTRAPALESAIEGDVLVAAAAPAPEAALDAADLEVAADAQRADAAADDNSPAAGTLHEDAADDDNSPAAGTLHADAAEAAVTATSADDAGEQGLLKSPRKRMTALDIDVGIDLSDDQEQLVEEAKLVLAMIDGHHLAYWQSRYDDELTRVELMQEGGGSAVGALFTW